MITFIKLHIAKNRSTNLETNGKFIHLHSENVQPMAECVASATFQEMGEKNKWLEINKHADKDTTLVLENPSRYPHVSSQKHKQMQMLGKRCDQVIVLDIVPFCKEIRNVYSTFAYVGEDSYAWKENYQEMLPNGRIVSAHDNEFAASKAKAFASIAYSQFSAKNRIVVKFKSTQEEHSAYADKKKALFEKEENPQRIVTRLADHAHAYKTRIDAVIEVVKNNQGTFVLYHNLSSYAKKMQTQLNKAGLGDRATAVSYEKGFNGQADNVLYVESPIVNSYYLLDAEAKVTDSGKVFHLLGDTNVDIYLYEEIQKELSAIDGFAKELYRVTH